MLENCRPPSPWPAQDRAAFFARIRTDSRRRGLARVETLIIAVLDDGLSPADATNNLLAALWIVAELLDDLIQPNTNGELL